MHELSICERIVEAVLGELSRLHPAPQRICKVRVVVGRLHQIVHEYLTFVYDLLTRECDQDPKLGYELMKRFSAIMHERMHAARLQIMDVYGPTSA